MLKIYGANLSPPSNKVRIAANAIGEECGLEYDFIPIQLAKGEHKQESFLAISPFGKVPAMDDDGFYLAESDPIIKYLCRKHNSGLYPDDIRKQAIVDQWCSFISIHIQMAMGRILFNAVMAPMFKMPVDKQSMAFGRKMMDTYLPMLDTRLVHNRYLVGDSPSIADIGLISVLDPAEVADVDLSPYSHLLQWRKTIQAQPFYKARYDRYEDTLKE